MSCPQHLRCEPCTPEPIVWSCPRRALSPGRWSGPDGLPIPAAESFFVYLDARELSPETVRTYAHALASSFRFLDEGALDWQEVRLVDLADFIVWLRRPAPNVIVLDLSASCRKPRTVNKILSAVSSFYDYQVRNGCEVAARLVVWSQHRRPPLQAVPPPHHQVQAPAHHRAQASGRPTTAGGAEPR